MFIPDPGSGPDLDFLSILDPGVKKAEDPVSSTLCVTYFYNFIPLLSQGLLEEQPVWLQPGCGKHSPVPGEETERPSGPIFSLVKLLYVKLIYSFPAGASA